MATNERTLEALLEESRTFEPAPEFRARANASDPSIYDRADADPEAFWAEWARELDWFREWDRVLEWDAPHATWFGGGRLNVAYNCLDRHLDGPRRNKAALVWEGEPGDQRTLTYWDLHREVGKFANVLKELGVGRGDRVAIYLPMIPEAAIAMLACARIGAIHSVVFGGFSADSLKDRIIDAEAKLLVTADGGYRRGQVIPLKDTADRALKDTPSIRNVVVVRRRLITQEPQVHMKPGRDHWYHELMQDASPACEAEPLEAEDVLYILYTSGTTGKPKGVVHTTGGYLTHVYATTRLVFDLKEEDMYWCTADVGWVTGHSFIVYGPLANGATVFMYEGAPDWPDRGRFWKLVQKYGVTVFYTAPTAIRAFMRWGPEWPDGYDLSTLRLLGTVGEPINPEAWMWYHEHIGKERCPIVDTWWQTETGAIMISPLPGATPTKPGSATRPLPGIAADVVLKDGTPCKANEGGFLVIKKPWPSMLRTIFGDHERFQKTYFGEIEGCYFAGDGARKDPDGYFWIMGRVDDVINVAGHRLSTMEVESALVSHPKVAEAAVVGRPDDLKGQAIVAFVTPRGGVSPDDALAKELREHVVTQIGALARPEEIRFAEALPKTRSGKIMRRLLREVASGSKARGDTTTLEDQGVLERLAQSFQQEE